MDLARIETAMRGQFKFWKGTTNANQILVDTCHALANALKLNREEREKFMANCNADQVQLWG
jgi:hypothetical protein